MRERGEGVAAVVSHFVETDVQGIKALILDQHGVDQLLDHVVADEILLQVQPGGSVRGERANFTGLVLGCIEAKFCN